MWQLPMYLYYDGYRAKHIFVSLLEPFGLLSSMAPPFPIPNREVKHTSADNTCF